MIKKDKRFEFFIIVQLLVCIVCFSMFFYLYLNKQNELTKSRLEIPVITKEIKELKEENDRLKYEIDSFESPTNLMKLMKESKFKHLKNLPTDDILIIDE